jgi:hypothetical protein
VIAIGRIVRSWATLMGNADVFSLIRVVFVCAVTSVGLLKKSIAAGGGAHCVHGGLDSPSEARDLKSGYSNGDRHE